MMVLTVTNNISSQRFADSAATFAKAKYYIGSVMIGVISVCLCQGNTIIKSGAGKVAKVVRNRLQTQAAFINHI